MEITAQENAGNRAKWLLISLACFYVLLAFLLALPDQHTDLSLLQWAQQHDYELLNNKTLVLAYLGNKYITTAKVIIPALLLFHYKYRREAIFLLVTLLADVANQGLKYIIGRDRPTADVAQLLSDATNPGFPSGHTVNFVVYFGFVFVLLPFWKNLKPVWRKLLAAYCIFMAFVGPFSRIHAGMHWPSDVVGGGIFATLFLAMLCYAYFRPQKSS